MTEGVFPKSDGDILYASEANAMFNMCPVGAVFAWLKSLTNTPTLPSNWVECNGQTLSDADSVYDGVVIPNLNTGTYKMLRGDSTSGTTGGADTHTLTANEIPEHTHTIPMGGIGGTTSVIANKYNLTDSINTGVNTTTGSAHNNIPAYYAVVWIIRVK